MSLYIKPRKYILICCVCHVRRVVVKITADPKGLVRIQALWYRYKLGDHPKIPLPRKRKEQSPHFPDGKFSQPETSTTCNIPSCNAYEIHDQLVFEGTSMRAGPKTWASCFWLLHRQNPFGQNLDCRKVLLHVVNLLVKYMCVITKYLCSPYIWKRNPCLVLSSLPNT